MLAAPPPPGDPPSRCSASPIQAGNPHPTPILLLLPHPTCLDRRRDTFHPNHQPLHQISAALSHGARSIARISRSIWQWRSKLRPHVQMRSRWLPFMSTPRSWRSTSPSRPPSTPRAPTTRHGWLFGSIMQCDVQFLWVHYVIAYHILLHFDKSSINPKQLKDPRRELGNFSNFHI